MKDGVIHLIHSGGFYGAEAVILNLCIGLNESGFKSIIGCFMNTGEEKPALGLLAESKGINVEYILFKNKFDITVVKQIYRIIKNNKIAIIHSHGYKPSFFCLLLYFFYQIPYVITAHLWAKETHRMRFYVLIDRISMLFAKQIIAVSHPIANDICSWKFFFRKINAVKVINNGIDINKYAEYRIGLCERNLREELGLKSKTKLVGTLGRLTFQKAHHIFIEAAKIILEERSDVEFLIGGDGHRLEYLKSLTNKFEISDKFHFLGFRSDAINILNILNVFVLCSVDEGLPIVLLEAMSLGKPVVSTAVGEIPMVIENNFNGIIIKKNDTAQLSKSIIKLLEDDILCNNLSKKAKKTVSTRFSIDCMTEKYLESYRQIQSISSKNRI